MKKIIVMLMSACLLTAAFTACSNKKENKPANESSVSETTVESSESMTEESSSSESAESGMLTGALSDIGDKIEEVGEWSMMDTIEDKDTALQMTGLDIENPNYKNVYIRKAMMSAAFGEYIIIEADDVDAAVKDLEARRTKLIEQDAFYPEHKDLAEETIVGKSGKYAYLIARENPSEVEKTLLENLPID